MPEVAASKNKNLTPSEAKVVNALLENGATNQELADRFGMAEQTVRCHLFRAMQKLGYSTKTELVANMLHKQKRTP